MSLSKLIKSGFLIFLIFILLTGIVYPLLVTEVTKLFFPWKAQGSLIHHEGKLIGSELIGQNVISPHYFWGRPSVTLPYPYNAENSSGSNLGPLNPNLLTQIQSRIMQLQIADDKNPIPVDLITSSASGLDPDISPSAALYQIPRIASLRHIPETDLRELVKQNITQRTFGFLGEPFINVLKLNLALDKFSKSKPGFL